MSSKLDPEDIQLPVVTDEGVFVAHYSVLGLSGLDFPSSRTAGKSNDAKIPDTVRSWHRQTSAAVKSTLSGCAPTDLPPLDISNGTEFQLSVWRSLLKIRLGRTQSYGEIAKSIGKPKAMRAVGGACGANPIPLLVPCHRVLAANGKIGGFSGGSGWKEKLLAREGVSIAR
jgi:methylated-DNA-[protein]-cysteine S-methyltransferase